MLNRVIALTKLYIKNSMFSTLKTNNGKKGKRIGFFILYCFLFLYLGAIAGFLSYSIIDILKPIKQTAVFISMILTANLFMTFIETIISSMNILYFTKDNEHILPLPVKAAEIVSSKINCLLIYSYISELFLGIVPFVVYGVMTNASIRFYIFSFIILIILPIFPVILASLLVMILMSFTKAVKNKSLLQVLGIILVMVFSFSISFFANNSELEEAQLLAMLFKANGLVDMFRGFFPTLGLAIDALCKTKFIDSFIALVLLLASNIAIYLAFILLSQKLYFKGVVGTLFSSSGSTNKKLNTKKAYKSSGVAMSYIAKEFKTLFRNATFLTQCVLPSVLVPVLISVVSYFSFANGLEKGGVSMNMIYSVIQSPESATVVFVVVNSIASFYAMYCYTGITAISRDGQSALFMKYIPLSFAWQCIYKAVPNFVFLLFSEIFVIALCILMKVPMMIIILSLIMYVLFAIIHSLISVYLDLRKPKLTWANEYQVVKNNMRILWISAVALANMLVGLLPLFISSVPVYYIAGVYIIAYAIIVILMISHLFKKDLALSVKIM